MRRSVVLKIGEGKVSYHSLTVLSNKISISINLSIFHGVKSKI
jgi:hypothetical protein